MKSKTKTTLFLVLVGLIVAALAAVAGIARVGLLPPDPGPPVLVEIPTGAGLMRIAALLEDEGLIRSRRAFALLAKGKGQAQMLKAGEYQITQGRTPSDILAMLANGRVVVRQLTIPEGYTIYQVAQTLAEAGLGEKEPVLALVQDPALARKLGVPGDTLEGYLFPETYAYVKGVAPKDLLARMVKQTLLVYEEEKATATVPGPISMSRTLTLASICEREARKSEELPIIAAVYLKRLSIGMPLQADPTVIYGLKSFHRLLTRKDLKIPSSYNTYMNKGLPPGPICNPGRLAIRASLKPAKTDALYFVAKDDGSHFFSATYAQHLDAVRRYRR